MDYKHASMFDSENMHVEVDDVWDILSDLPEPQLTSTQQQMLQACEYDA